MMPAPIFGAVMGTIGIDAADSVALPDGTGGMSTADGTPTHAGADAGRGILHLSVVLWIVALTILILGGRYLRGARFA